MLDTCAWLLQQGVHVTYLCPDADGLIQPQQVAEALRDDTCLVSLMAVNNELGTITDIAGVAAVLKNHAALLHVDAAAQAIGKGAGACSGLGRGSVVGVGAQILWPQRHWRAVCAA